MDAPKHPAGSFLRAALGAEPTYAKREKPHEFLHHHAGHVVYEDDHFVAIDEGDGATAGGSDPTVWQRRLVIAPKSHTASLLDLNVDDDRIAVHLLGALQRIALSEGLQNHGFEISIDVLPPRQHSNLLKIKLRSGEKNPTSS